MQTIKESKTHHRNLKPCPFCGTEGKDNLLIIHPYMDNCAYVMCSECKAHGGTGTNEESGVKLWNKRVTQSSSDKQESLVSENTQG